jgi:hypothetical protein
VAQDRANAPAAGTARLKQDGLFRAGVTRRERAVARHDPEPERAGNPIDPAWVTGGYFMRQSPDHAYDIAFFDEFARALRGGPSASLSRTPNSARRVDHRPQ